MNKSKFLKKSLALLLAFMLVFAMIPLGAAAAGELPTGFTMMYINGGAKTAENNTFSADIGLYAENVTLMLAGNSLDTQASDATMQVVKGDSVRTKPLTDTGSDSQTISLAEWGTEADGVVTILLRMTSADNSNKRDYTVKLTRKDVNVTTNLSKTATAGEGSYSAKVNNDTKSIDLVVARGAFAQANDANFQVSTVEGATISTAVGTNKATVTTVANTGTYNIKVAGDKNTFEVVSESGGNKSEWTVNVTEVDGLLSFSVNDVAGVITDETGNDGVPDTITVSLPSSVAYDKFGDKIADVELPISFVFYGNGSTLKVATDLKKDGETVKFGDLVAAGDAGVTKTVALTCAGVTDVQTYSLVVKLAKSNDTTIYFAQLDEEDATVEGGKISAELPMKKADGTTDTDLSAMEIALFTDPSVKSVSGMKEITTNGNAPTPNNIYRVDGKKGWAVLSGTATKANPSAAKQEAWGTISNGTIVTVTAEDGSTAQYTISASIDRNTTEAYLSAMYLKDGAGNTYEGDIKDHTITFTVPYMTIDASTWTVFATPNSSARVVTGTTPVKNGTTTVAGLGIATAANLSTTKNGNLQAKAIAAVNKNNEDVKTEYDVIINLEAPKTGDTLSGNIEISAQTVDPTAAVNGVASRNEYVYSRITADNTVTGRVDTNVKIDATNTGTITIEPPYSLSSKNDELVGDVYNIITKFATNNGGVAFLASHDAAPNYYISTPLNALTNDKSEFVASNVSWFTADNIVDAANTYSVANTIVVLPEERAREILTSTKNWTTTGWIVGDSATYTFENVGTIYTIKESPKTASSANNLKTMTVKDKELTVRNGRITGTLPWSATGSSGTDTAAARFVEFTLDSFAKLAAGDATSTYASKNKINSKGIKDDGTDTVGADNIKFLFVRENNDKKAVKVYTSTDDSTYTELIDGKITVWAENRLSPAADASVSTQIYTFDLNWADPNTEAAITEFKLGNSRGTITSDRKINVTVPYGTDLKGLITTFTASEGATVTMGSVELVSGKTALNFSDPVTLIVTSEDGKKHLEYTVTVTASDKFTDVPESAWYYEEVMKAADLGLITGKGNGIFAPMENVKRGDFALMIARMDNGGEEKWQEVAKTYTTSAFIDVDSDKYYSAAIAYCKDKGYIDGNSDGTFNAERYIKREEMAKFLCNVAGLKEVTSPSAKFADDASISNWAKGFVYAASEAGLMNGVGGNKFAPKSTTPRCQAAAALVRYTESK